MENFKLINGDMLIEIDKLEENSIDCIITDPPYELNFMGKDWDNAGVSFNKETWRKCLRVLKPGGHMLVFGGSRTSHRIACAIEDAGFEIRDTIMWLYGSGFPKSMNIGLALDKRNGVESKVVGVNQDILTKQKKDLELGHRKIVDSFNAGAEDRNNGFVTVSAAVKEPVSEEGKKWKGWGTQLKPSYEPIIIARKPIDGSIMDNVIKYGVGGINIDECRIPFENTANAATNPLYRTQNGYKWNKDFDSKSDVTGFSTSKTFANNLGRFPANTILTYDDSDYDEVCGGFPLGGQNGSISKRYKMNNQVYGEYGYCNTWEAYNDSGSASRYFYCAKATTKDRDEGLDCFDVTITGELQGGRKERSAGSLRVRTDGSIGVNPYAGNGAPKRNIHPTVKPTELMQYLVKLVAPKGAIILDPFMGSGSTGKAVAYENNERNMNYKFIGIELDSTYMDIAKARILYADGNTVSVVTNEKTGLDELVVIKKPKQQSLF